MNERLEFGTVERTLREDIACLIFKYRDIDIWQALIVAEVLKSMADSEKTIQKDVMERFFLAIDSYLQAKGYKTGLTNLINSDDVSFKNMLDSDITLSDFITSAYKELYCEK